jgi:hypothetical protein
MKKLFLTLTVLFFAIQAQAQTSFILSTLQPKNSINLTMGYSKPAWTPFCNTGQGAMGAGESVQVSYSHRFGRQWGAVASYTYVTNTMLKDALISAIPIKSDPGSWESSATNCTLQAYMAGPMLSLQTGRFLFDFQATAGLAQATSSQMELYAPDIRPAIVMKTPSKTAQALAAGLGTTVRYKLSRWLAIQANAHYITANVRYKDLVQEITIGSQQSQETVDPHQPIGVLNLGGGLSILF